MLPAFPPIIAVLIALGLATAAICFLPRWTNSISWKQTHTCSLIFGVMIGSMLITFIGFIGALPEDLYFKIIVDAIAILLMARFGLTIKKRSTKTIDTTNVHVDSIIQDIEIT